MFDTVDEYCVYLIDKLEELYVTAFSDINKQVLDQFLNIQQYYRLWIFLDVPLKMWQHSFQRI